MFVQNQDCWLRTTKTSLNSHQILFLVRGWGLGTRLQYAYIITLGWNPSPSHLCNTLTSLGYSQLFSSLDSAAVYWSMCLARTSQESHCLSTWTSHCHSVRYATTVHLYSSPSHLVSFPDPKYNSNWGSDNETILTPAFVAWDTNSGEGLVSSSHAMAYPVSG